MISEVWITEDCMNTLLTIAKHAHPNETLLLLRGKIRRGIAFVEEVLIPPPIYTSPSSIAINPYRLPIDFTIIGIAHSHPNGSLRPSMEDLSAKYKYILMIMGYPYESELNLAAYTYDGRRLKLRII